MLRKSESEREETINPQLNPVLKMLKYYKIMSFLTFWYFICIFILKCAYRHFLRLMVLCL